MSTEKVSRRNVVQLTQAHEDERHVWDYVRVIYKRRWAAIPAFVIVFLVGLVSEQVSSLRFEGPAQH